MRIKKKMRCSGKIRAYCLTTPYRFVSVDLRFEGFLGKSLYSWATERRTGVEKLLRS